MERTYNNEGNEIVGRYPKKYNEIIVSSGGGTIVTNDDAKKDEKEVYKEANLTEILKFCSENGISLYEYISAFSIKTFAISISLLAADSMSF